MNRNRRNITYLIKVVHLYVASVIAILATAGLSYVYLKNSPAVWRDSTSIGTNSLKLNRQRGGPVGKPPSLVLGLYLRKSWPKLLGLGQLRVIKSFALTSATTARR
jgi:hypothetical protein